MADRVAGISLADVPDVKALLPEARRTYSVGSESMEDRFVEIKPGILSQLLAQSHHVIQGRRGTGKSTVMNVLLHTAQAQGVPVAIVDMEKYKHRSYPDVLIEILVDALTLLAPRKSRWQPWRHFPLRRRLKSVVRSLKGILGEPDVINRSLTTGVEGSSSGAASLSAAGKGVSLSLRGSHARSHAQTQTGSDAATKIERMRTVAHAISELLTDLVQQTSTGRSLLIIDDFYFIATEDQPLVIDYLHAVCKGTGVWLKVGGVGTRMQLYKEGDPPLGVQIDQDVSRLKLDVTLEEFASGKKFLEQVLNGALQPKGLKTQNLLNSGARDRIVLACGGAVARDYINLALDSLDFAIERVARAAAPPDTFKINTEDVNRAARGRISQKEEEDLKADAANDAQALRRRWQDIQSFAASRDRTNIVLFRQEDLTDTAWGKEVMQLENLRLLHRIGVTVPNTETWRQVRVVIMMIDLAAIVNQRLSMNIVEFWKGAREFDKLRRAQWVYSPSWDDKTGVATVGVSPVKPAVSTGQVSAKKKASDDNSSDPGLW